MTKKKGKKELGRQWIGKNYKHIYILSAVGLHDNNSKIKTGIIIAVMPKSIKSFIEQAGPTIEYKSSDIISDGIGLGSLEGTEAGTSNS